MSDLDIIDQLISRMPWPLAVNKSNSETIEIRRNYSDEVKFWDELWEQSVQNDSVCDVALVLEDGSEMKVHWCILMLCPYFKALRNSGLYEKTGKLRMAISPADIVRIAIEFLYRGKATVPKDKLNDVIHCADYLQLDNLKYRCADYLRENKLDVSNCVSMCTLASTYNLEGLYDESNRMLRRRFKDVMSKDDILQLMTDSLKFLIADQNLRYVGQLELFKLLVRWADHSNDRKASFEELFDLIDLHDITSTDIETVVKTNSFVHENEKCRQRVQNHLDALNELGVNEECKDVLVFAGGQKWTGNKTEPFTVRSTACYGYVVQDDRWIRLSNVPRRMSGNLAVKNGSELFILGKEENSVFTRLYKLPSKDAREYWLLCSLEQPRTTTEEVYAAVFCKDKLVSVRRDSTRLFVCTHNPNEPTQTSVKNIMFLRSLKDVLTVRVCVFRDRYAFIMVITTRGGNSNKTVILDTEKNILDVLETKGTCNGEIFYQDGEKIYLETPGKRFSNVFSFTSRRWTSVRRGLPALPDNVSLKRCESIKVRNDLYVYGNMVVEEKGKLPDLYWLKHKERSWERVQTPQADLPLIGASMIHFSIPRELLRCPYDCTHCSSKFANSEYALDRYRYDDDEDEDDDVIGDDDSLYGPAYSDSDDEEDVNFGYAPGFFFW